MPTSSRTAIAAALTAAALAMAAAAPAGAQAAAPYRLQVEGRAVAEAGAYLASGQLMAATRPLAAALGAEVEWHAADQRIVLRRQGQELALWVGSTAVYRDGRRSDAPALPALRDGRSFIPVWHVAGQLGYRVAWDGRTMALRTDAAPPPGGTGLRSSRFVFPFPAGARYEAMAPDFGDGRSWSPDGTAARRHEGQDIMAPHGTPAVAAGGGKVVRLGWNEFGGWRLTIALDDAPGYSLYYAHLSGYGPNLYEGARVTAGQRVGYVGSTGYGPEGTSGKFEPHLHVGLYAEGGAAVDPYPYLRIWEQSKVAQR